MKFIMTVVPVGTGIEQKEKIPKIPAKSTEIVKLRIDFDNYEFLF
jgi:hypothetical protein